MQPIDWTTVPDTEPRPLRELHRRGWTLWLWDADDTLDLDPDLDPIWRGPDGKGTWYVVNLVGVSGIIYATVEGPDPEEIWARGLAELVHVAGPGGS